MPPKFKFTRDEIIAAALELIRENGACALTARALAAKLGCSVKPIFSLFQNMDEVRSEVMKAAEELRQKYLQDEIESGKFPPYKAAGIAYIRFAKQEKELFKMLFMCDRSHESQNGDTQEIKQLVTMIKNQTGLSEEDAYMFQDEMWVYVHGIATMIATSYRDWDWDYVSRVLTDSYEGLKMQYQSKGKPME